MSRMNRKARRAHARKQRATRPAAYDGALELCSAVGPENVAAEHGLTGSPREIARGYAEAVGNEKNRRATYRGALAGFKRYLEQT